MNKILFLLLNLLFSSFIFSAEAPALRPAVNNTYTLSGFSQAFKDDAGNITGTEILDFIKHDCSVAQQQHVQWIGLLKIVHNPEAICFERLDDKDAQILGQQYVGPADKLKVLLNTHILGYPKKCPHPKLVQIK